jgi:dolichyl-phosphate-mannose--protein O-mannosyl transferase
LLVLLAFLVLIGGTGLWIAMIVDCVTKEPDTGNNKVVWILVIVLAHFIGALIYLLVRRPQRIAELGR